MHKKPHKPPTIQDLYPELSPEQQAEAEYNLKRYVNLCFRIYSRLKDEGKLDEIKNSHLRHEWEKRNRKINDT
jgi:hypothetical protein